LQPFLKTLFKGYRTEIKEALHLAYPIILGQVGIVLMGAMDAIMVGKLGSDHLASANQGNNIFFMVSGLSFGVLFAISTLVSIKVGEGNPGKGFITYRAGLVVALIMFLGQFTIIEVLTENFSWLGQKGRINELTPGYLRIINFSALPMLLALAARQFTDGLGLTKVSMSITFGGLMLNIGLNWVLIYGNLGAPALGIEGAAWATFIARICMAFASIWYIRYSNVMRDYRPVQMPDWKEVRAEMPKIWKIGLPIGLQTFAEWACFSISGIMVGWLGAKQLAAHAVALNVASITYMIVSGFAIAGSIMVGNAYGEKNKEKIKRVGFVVFSVIVVFELFNAVIFLLFNHQIAALYGVANEVHIYIFPLFFLAAIFQLADGIQAGAMNLLRGMKDVNWSSAISVVSYWIVSLPLSYSLGIAFELDVYGIWIGFTIGLFVAALFGVFRFYLHLRTMNFEEESSYDD
jgi:multidrug resistance protein, MATE family